jgi:hypothetical protein
MDETAGPWGNKAQGLKLSNRGLKLGVARREILRAMVKADWPLGALNPACG